MLRLIFLLLLVTPVSAQTYWSDGTSGLDGLHTVATCESSGEKWEELGMMCHADKMFRASPPHAPSLTGQGTVTDKTFKCPDGYSLVDAGRPMCARDLREPE